MTTSLNSAQHPTERSRVSLGGVWFLIGRGSHLRPAVRFSVDDLWRGVERTAAEGLQQLVLVVQVGQPEVCDLGGQACRSR